MRGRSSRSSIYKDDVFLLQHSAASASITNRWRSVVIPRPSPEVKSMRLASVSIIQCTMNPTTIPNMLFLEDKQTYRALFWPNYLRRSTDLNGMHDCIDNFKYTDRATTSLKYLWKFCTVSGYVFRLAMERWVNISPADICSPIILVAAILPMQAVKWAIPIESDKIPPPQLSWILRHHWNFYEIITFFGPFCL